MERWKARLHLNQSLLTLITGFNARIYDTVVGKHKVLIFYAQE